MKHALAALVAAFLVAGEAAGDKSADAVAEQVVEALEPGLDFVFAACVRTAGAGDVVLAVHGTQGEIAAARYSGTPEAVWRHVEVPFRTAVAGPVTVTIRKEGEGDAYVDTAGLSPLWPPPAHAP